MKDERKTKAELATELAAWRERVEELEVLLCEGGGRKPNNKGTLGRFRV